MKKLIKAADVRDLVGSDSKTLYVGKGAIITPEAKDMAARMGITILREDRPSVQHPQHAAADSCCAAGIDQQSITKIVQQVMAAAATAPAELPVERDAGGLRLVHGDTVAFEAFDTGNSADKVQIKEILDIKESPHMATGFMTIDQSKFDWELKYEEIDYIIEGVLEFTINGKKYSGKAGDVFYIPSGSAVTFSSPGKVRFFFVTYPANWAELSDYEK
jgi:ethanolamine utilization protein EutQ